ncbi:MAG: porin family protein [Fibrobacter sp.]|nr:porin family protein [Fibrobacter sp.]HZH71826.1 outer membrane beta-barrel protein [Mariniphaga sp.]
MKKSILIIMAITISIISASNLQASDFSKQGSKWLGGLFSFSSMGFKGDDSRLNMIQISPILRFFPVDHFMIGPGFSYTGSFVEGEGINQFGIGAEIGGVFNLDDKLYPYVRSGGNFTIIGGSIMEGSLNGFSLPIAGGLIIPVGNIFGLQIEPAYTITWIEGESMNVFSISLGICGIGEKSAVSVLQGISGLSNLF